MYKVMTSKKRKILNYICVILGSILLAFGNALFLTTNNIITGGLSGVGIIFKIFLNNENVIDIVVFIATWLFWIFGLISLGKDFAFKTVISSIVFPLFLSLFLRINLFKEYANDIGGISFDASGKAIGGDVGHLLLCSIFGGVFVGAGVGLTFYGGGSTGGVDILVIFFNKKFGIKEAIVSFSIDAIIIGGGLITFLIKGMSIVPTLCGILSAFISCLLIEYLTNGIQASYQVDVISDKWKDISNFVQSELQRGATIIPAKGGYKGDDKAILRIVFDKHQYRYLKEGISSIDPKAFVTFTRTNAVFGEGFRKHNNG